MDSNRKVIGHFCAVIGACYVAALTLLVAYLLAGLLF
jgi:hypothetical protein